MNTIKKIKLLFLAISSLLIMNSCVQDDDWSNPPVDCVDNWVTDITIDELFNMVDADGGILSFTTDRILEGYVVSSDSTGNFFKTVSIQNSLTNPTKGLQVEMDDANLFNRFPLGSKIKINLNGLDVGYDRGMLKVGEIYEAGRVGRMKKYNIARHVVKTCDVIQQATPVVFSNIQEALNSGVFNTLVTIQNVQFDDSELGTTYADAQNQETINKKLIDSEGTSIVLRNSGYATFAGDLLPEGSGNITVVLSGYDQNVNGTVSPSEYQLYIRDTNDVVFDQPRFGDGGEPTGDVFSCLNEDFTSYSVNNESFASYENLSVQGNRKWRVREFSSNKYIEVSAYQTTGTIYSYFVVPVNFSEADSFSFKTKDGHNNGDALKIYYSTNYNLGGNINTATLVDITSSFTLATGTTNGYAANFTDSGSYSLGSLTGNGVIIFAYEGGNGVTTTFQIDDIRIVDNENPSCN